MNAKEIPLGNILKTASALASESRMSILALLADNPLNVTEIADQLHMPVSSAISAVLKLEAAGLINTITKGAKKICFVDYEALLLQLPRSAALSNRKHESISFSIPIGNYCDFSVTPSCGLLGDNQFIGTIDSSESFLLKERSQARLIWLRKGFLEYRFPNPASQHQRVNSLSISMEICAEYPGYNNDFPSDIRFRINDIEVGAYHSGGDFGGRRGIFTPGWWPESSTQYGGLATLAITQSGSYVNAQHCSDITIDQLGLSDNAFLTLRVSAEQGGGLNLFSKDFGDYYQDIEVRMDLMNQDSGSTPLPPKSGV